MSKKTESKENLLPSSDNDDNVTNTSPTETEPIERPLSQIEKSFLLHAERGDCPTLRKIIEQYRNCPEEFDINCVDPLNRTALIAAIENENIELIKLLLEENIKVNDGLLHAIKEEFVEAVDLLLQWEEDHHEAGTPYSWEQVKQTSASFTSDMTPLILAAHKDNYEIIKILLDRGATLPLPHDVKCGCDECVATSTTDSLRHSQSRINAYRALTSSSLIALSSNDPILTSFQLSWDLKRLSKMETEFRSEYNEMRQQVETFTTALVDHVRTSYELETMLNYDESDPTWKTGDRQTLERLKLAIKYKQKNFVAHPNVQQLLASIWYEGLPGFRRKTMIGQAVQLVKFASMFPFYCMMYMVAPTSETGLFMKKPFVKFICHSASYGVFLMLLGAASQRIEILALELFGSDWVQELVKEWKRKERGTLPGVAECGVILYVFSLIWVEIKALWNDGLEEYISDLWNIVDLITNIFYVIWLALRFTSWFITTRQESEGEDPWYPREEWDSFEPMLISEGAFAAGMIFSFLKLVHIFSVNPHLGPLQISLGRMIIDIVKFFFIYTLVLFAFGCGLNQLLWYYAELEKAKCYNLPSGLPDFDNNDKACTIWRRYSNLFETSQSLFWASFGLVDLMAFELTGIKGFTRFWALLMFGSYSVINIIVLLNMLIAMMSNSYQIISERSDVEWKFARSKLWISYFDDGDTLPPPFNIMPKVKLLHNLFGCKTSDGRTKSFREKSGELGKDKHYKVMKLLIRRYVTAEQQKRDDFGVTEDDVMEIRQDISSLRYEIIDILHKNGMKTPQMNIDDNVVSGKKVKIVERRILKDFHIGLAEGIANELKKQTKEPINIFGHVAKVLNRRATGNSQKKDWNTLVRKNTIVSDPIGSKQEAENNRKRRLSLRNGVSIDQDQLLEYNAKLSEVSKSVRVAYVKFMSKKLQENMNTQNATTSKSETQSSPKAKLEQALNEEGSAPEPTSIITTSNASGCEIDETPICTSVDSTTGSATSAPPTLEAEVTTAPEPPEDLNQITSLEPVIEDDIKETEAEEKVPEEVMQPAAAEPESVKPPPPVKSKPPNRRTNWI